MISVWFSKSPSLISNCIPSVYGVGMIMFRCFLLGIVKNLRNY